MKKSVIFTLFAAAVLIVSVLTTSLSAATFTDNFDNGLSSANWETFQTDAIGAPWTISATNGALEISKSSDNGSTPLNISPNAGIRSLFTLDGDFSVFVDFNFLSFPLPINGGFNEFLMTVFPTQVGNNFTVLRFSYDTQRAEGYSNLVERGFGGIIDSTTNGRFGITRSGQTLSAWIDRGSTPALIGSLSSPSFLGAMKVQVYAVQQVDIPNQQRPSTNLDGLFDNFTATADTIIIPEPATLLLLGLGGVLVRRKVKN